MKTKIWIPAIVTLLMLTACRFGQTTPTPITAPPDGPATAQSRVIDEPPPTATRLPYPSPTPTPTPLRVSDLDRLPASPTPAPTVTPMATQAEVLANSLNIRQGPGLGYAVIDVASAGDTFDIVGTSSSHWVQVVTADGGRGWISGQLPYTQINGALSQVPPGHVPPPDSKPEGDPASSGNGLQGKLVFMTASGGNLYAINVDGTNLWRIAGGVIDPAVSPDGRRVAFTRWDGAEVGTVFTINIDGSNERAVLGETLQAKSPTWSPDGQEIVVSFQHGGLRNPSPECKKFEPGDEIDLPENIRILKVHVSDFGVVKICFIRLEDLQWGLRRVNIATGDFEDLPVDLYSYNPAWDPHNPWRIIYDGAKGLMQLDVTTGDLWPITTDLRDTDPIFSPDGQKLALTYKQHGHWEVYTLDLTTGERRRLTKPPILADPQYSSASPAWSPDGQSIAFVTNRSGTWEIWVMQADGSNQRPLFGPEIRAQFELAYWGMNERMLNWIK